MPAALSGASIAVGIATSREEGSNSHAWQHELLCMVRTGGGKLSLSLAAKLFIALSFFDLTGLVPKGPARGNTRSLVPRRRVCNLTPIALPASQMATFLTLCQPVRPSTSRPSLRRSPSIRAALAVRPSNERAGKHNERLLPLLSDYVQATVSSEGPAAPAGALPHSNQPCCASAIRTLAVRSVRMGLACCAAVLPR